MHEIIWLEYVNMSSIYCTAIWFNRRNNSALQTSPIFLPRYSIALLSEIFFFFVKKERFSAQHFFNDSCKAGAIACCQTRAEEWCSIICAQLRNGFLRGSAAMEWGRRLKYGDTLKQEAAKHDRGGGGEEIQWMPTGGWAARMASLLKWA